MSSRKHGGYTAQVRREGKWWMIYVPALDALTQARRLGEVEEMARSLIAITTETPRDSVHLRCELEAIEDVRVTERLDQLESDRAEADAAAESFRRHQRELVRDLAGKGIPVRDIGSMLGVSHQRAHQLLDA